MILALFRKVAAGVIEKKLMLMKTLCSNGHMWEDF